MKIWITTYRKYNEGRLIGTWLNLDDYADYGEFCRALNRLNRERLHESDPEWKICDWEQDPGADWQAGIVDEDHLPCDYWTLKAEAAQEAETTGKKRTRKGDADKAEQDALTRAWMIENGYDPDKKGLCDFAFFRKSYRYARLTGGEVIEVCAIPGIETRFCCGEDDRGQGGDAPGTMAYALKQNAEKHTERGFWRANVGHFAQDMIAHAGRGAWRRATGRDTARGYGWRENYTPGLYRYERGGYYIEDQWRQEHVHNGMITDHGVRPLTDADFRTIRAGWMTVYRAYQKRVRTYLKRFGTSKVHTWTYWTEA